MIDQFNCLTRCMYSQSQVKHEDSKDAHRVDMVDMGGANGGKENIQPLAIDLAESFCFLSQRSNAPKIDSLLSLDDL